MARDLPRRAVKILGHGEAPKHADNGRIDLTYSGAVWSGPRAFEEAGVTPADIDYASIYDSFTITVLMTLEDLGFCEKGQGRRLRDATERWWRPTAGCRSTPTAAACATTIPATGAG